VFLETHRSDTLIMILHHVATLTLFVTSWISNTYRIGIVVFWIHDLSDIFLYWAKSFSYTYMPNAITEMTFNIFAVSFFITRLGFFPYACILPSVLTIMEGGGDDFSKIGFDLMWSMGALLTVLLLLHLYWSYLIVIMAIKSCKKKPENKIADERSFQSTDEERSEPETPANAQNRVAISTGGGNRRRK